MKTNVRAAVEVMFQRRASVSHSGSSIDRRCANRGGSALGGPFDSSHLTKWSVYGSHPNLQMDILVLHCGRSL
jgi:hypothetical protein